MQSDPPQGEPRLQPTDPGHATVAVRCPQPCIVFLETTLPGEIPLLGACWASDSREIREPGQPASVKLRNVTILQNQPTRRKLWKFSVEHAPDVYLVYSRKPGSFAKLSYSHTSFTEAAEPEFQWSVLLIDQKIHMALRKILVGSPNDTKALASAILLLANQDWQSITDALASLEPQKFQKARVPARRRPSVVRRLISVFKKKSQPAHA